MQTFDEWKSYYEAHAEPADLINGGWEDYDRIKQKEAGAHVRGEGNDSTAPTASAPTLTRRGRGGAPASTSSVSQPRTNVNENPLIQGESNASVKLKPGERPAPVPDRDALKMYKE